MVHFFFSRQEKYSSFEQTSSLTVTSFLLTTSTAASLVMKASPSSSEGLTAISAGSMSTCLASVLAALSASTWEACSADAAA